MIEPIKRKRNHYEFTLRYQVGFAGFINEFRDFAHGGMDVEFAQLQENAEGEGHAENANSQTNQ
jgi:hypothetical protein